MLAIYGWYSLKSNSSWPLRAADCWSGGGEKTSGESYGPFAFHGHGDECVDLVFYTAKACFCIEIVTSLDYPLAIIKRRSQALDSTLYPDRHQILPQSLRRAKLR